jgi:hypothetical protein
MIRENDKENKHNKNNNLDETSSEDEANIDELRLLLKNEVS